MTLWISIVIVTYNKAAYLDDCLLALSRQVHNSNFEVVIVDDGSTDQTPEVTSRYTAGDGAWSDLKIIRHPNNEGIAKARNSGIRRASGDYLIFLDDDCLASPELVVRHRAIAEAHPAKAMVIGSAYSDDSPHRVDPAWDVVASLGVDPTLAAIDDRRAPFPWMAFVTHHAGASTAAVRACGGFDERFTGWGEEDMDLGYRLMCYGCVAMSVHVPVIKKRHARDLQRAGIQWLTNYVRFVEKHNRPLPLLLRWQALFSVISWNEFDQLAQSTERSDLLRSTREYESFVRAARRTPDSIHKWVRAGRKRAEALDPYRVDVDPWEWRARRWVRDVDKIIDMYERWGRSRGTTYDEATSHEYWL